MQREKTYVGVNNDLNGGLTHMGRIVLDAWVFEILPETQTCEGWNYSRMNSLAEQVNAEWDKYGLMVSQLPPELAERHKRIYEVYIKRAADSGWTGETETDQDV